MGMRGREDKVGQWWQCQVFFKKTTHQQNLSSQDSFYPIEPLLAENVSLFMPS